MTNQPIHSINSGIIFFNKQKGITSFDALRDIKRALGTGKVGHTGTLDKFAQGLLIVLAGKALRLSQWFSHCDKKYIGKIQFGIETDTLDPEGKIIAEAPVPCREEAEKVFTQFTGDIMQEPPVYSAIHVNGRRASSLAREASLQDGNSCKLPEMKKRKVTIYKLELLSWDPPFAEIFVHCSSGTYIRSLARDIASAAGSRGYLCELVRTQVAGFCLGNGDRSVEINCISTLDDYKQYSQLPLSLLPINKNIISKLGLQWFEVTEMEAQAVFNGKPLEAILDNKPLLNSSLHTAAIFLNETFIAIIEKKEGKWKYGCVINET
ncbi:MAG: tRNA pseudouridine(55) synthase TruB [Treponema sp.]|nr:tRNA pseudouridine(55) synthase TruB [Treponema sp.]